MARVDAAVEEKTEWGRAEERRLAQQANSAGTMLADFGQDPNASRKPDYLVYVYSIVARELKNPSRPYIVFKGCPEGEAFGLANVFPSPVVQYPTFEDRTILTSLKGEDFVLDLLNPNGADIDRGEGGGDKSMSWAASTTDLTRRGLFMSRNQPPKREEVEECRRKLEKHYRMLLASADQLDRSNRRREIGPEHHLAADYFAYKANWHYSQSAPTPCPNCGELVRPGLAFHIDSTGGVCVLNWERTVLAGRKNMSDVPPSERGSWWNWPEQAAAPQDGGLDFGQ